eukprot:TRINITY_DN1524_c0_g1_i1.p1 TRINITY_DN1524_c0_g1~~TRINITY_DN1524_c0_g1_i1.p1  ORF type:complete len:347 (+),score=59.19 TRINITY_DN1524_c0_g1_i1:99-1139(+)
MSAVVGADCVVLSARYAPGTVAAPIAVMQGWTPAARSTLGRARSRVEFQQPARSRTPPGYQRAVPLQAQALASMPISFRSATTGDMPLKRVLCYGDSLTAGFCSNGALFEPYGRAMAEALGEAGVFAEVAVCGLSGGFASDFNTKKRGSLTDVVSGHGKGLCRILAEDGPFDLVIIMAGTNDLGRNDAPRKILPSLKQLHRACHKHNIPTLAMAPPPAPIRTPAQEALRVQLASLIRQWALSEADGQVLFQDPAEFVPATTGWIWESDRLHFTPAGSRSLGEKMAKLLLETSLLPAAEQVPLTARHTRRSSSPVRLTREMQQRGRSDSHTPFVQHFWDMLEAVRLA